MRCIELRGSGWKFEYEVQKACGKGITESGFGLRFALPHSDFMGFFTQQLHIWAPPAFLAHDLPEGFFFSI